MLLSLSPENCSYRGEGNTGLVISLKKEEKVLRLLKHASNEGEKNPLDRLQNFENQISIIKKVMKPLLGEKLVNCPAVGLILKDDIKMLNSLVNTFRPNFRTHKNVREEDSYVLLLPDYCTLPPDLNVLPSFGPVLAVEIKPKQGFLFDGEYLPSSFSSRSLLKCRHCMMQYYKMKRNAITLKSAYCPTDLFSGCPSRMHHAVKMLFQTPHNNLRIFKDQKLIYSEETKSDLDEGLSEFFTQGDASCSDLLCDLVIQILLKPFPFKQDENSVHLQKIKCKMIKCANAYPSCTEEGLCHELPEGCVLFKILSVQMLYRMNIKDLYSLYLKIKDSDDGGLDSAGCYSRYEIPPYLGNEQKMEDETEYQFASRKLWEFSVALTVRDSSIMFVLKNYTGSCDEKQSQNLVRDRQGNSYLFSIAIADLDAKPLNKVEKRYEETPLLLQSCMSQVV